MIYMQQMLVIMKACKYIMIDRHKLEIGKKCMMKIRDMNGIGMEIIKIEIDVSTYTVHDLERISTNSPS